MMAMDIDYPTKGTFWMGLLSTDIEIRKSDFIDWTELQINGQPQKAIGFLAQISPCAQWAVSTVNERILLSTEGFAFSQQFLPFQGILAFYNRQTQSYHPLPGGDNPDFVQTNPTWSPDSQWVVFARAKAAHFSKLTEKSPIFLRPYQMRNQVAQDDQPRLNGSEPFQFDLYRIRFDGGKGGIAEPLAGASSNGFSNYYPKYSPDGKWIVYCRAHHGMLLQPDSQLYIIPAMGGEARRLKANTERMNSWHSWSPNSRWLVFASKANSPYTQLFLTHIDEQGNSSPAICLSRFSTPDMAANMPEFVNIPHSAKFALHDSFVRDLALIQEGNEAVIDGKYDLATEAYRKALIENPRNALAHQRLGSLLLHVQTNTVAAAEHLRTALLYAPTNPYVLHAWGHFLLIQNQPAEALPYLKDALERMNLGTDDEYNPLDTRFKLNIIMSSRHRTGRVINPFVDIQYDLGRALFVTGQYAECTDLLSKAVAGDAKYNADVRRLLAESVAAQNTK